MSDTPQFRLPQRPAMTSSSRWFQAVSLALLLGLMAILLFQATAKRFATGVVSSAPRTSDTLGADGLKAVAMKLEDRNLSTAAADTWLDYLAATTLPPGEAALIELRVGKLRQNAGDHERALAAFYRAERLATGGDQKVLDQIGDDKITLADFDRLVQERVEAAIAARPGASPNEIDQMRRQIQGTLADPKAREQQLQELVTTRVLAAEARKAMIHQSDAYRRELLMIAESLLGSTLLNRVVGERASLTPADVERYFTANKTRYAEPASAKIAHIACAARAAADEVIAKASAGESFDELAKAYSMDAATKDKGGVLDAPLTESGDRVPGVGKNADLHAAIWKLDVGAVLPEPHQNPVPPRPGSSTGWEVIKLIEKRAAREPKLDEVKEDVENDARSARRQEVAQQYVQELMQTHRVQFFPQALSGAAATQPAAEEP